MLRSRSRSSYLDGYRQRLSDGARLYYGYNSMEESTDDNVRVGDNSPFSNSYLSRSGGIMNGVAANNFRWVQCPVLYQGSNPNSYTHLGMPPLDISAVALNALKRTSPTRASLQLPVSGAELRELPKLYRDRLDYRMKDLYKTIQRGPFRALKQVAKLHLMVQFGILPILSDLDTLLRFQSVVDRRVKELERLRGPKGLRRTVEYSRESTTALLTGQVFHSNSISVSGSLQKLTTRVVKGHVRWHPTSNFIASDEQLRRQATKSAAGLYFDLQAAYELMPWSWLIDYFGNLGDFLSLSRNIFDMHHDTVRVMVHTTTHTRSHGVTCSQPGVSVTPIVNRYETKSRVLATASLFAQKPFLEERQLSILGALAVTRL